MYEDNKQMITLLKSSNGMVYDEIHTVYIGLQVMDPFILKLHPITAFVKTYANLKKND